jgi:hypothetical protein
MNLKEFICLEIEEIKKHRWLESERAGKDLSTEAEIDWINKYSALFRKYIEEKYGPCQQDKIKIPIIPPK